MNQKTKAVILCAGKARRLYPLSKDRPTCLFEISGKTILEHHVSMLRGLGIEEIWVTVGHYADKVRKKGKDLRFVYNPHFPVTSDIVSLWYACKKLNGAFLYLHGDGLYSKEVFEKVLSCKGDIVLGVELGDHHTTYERVTVGDGKISRIEFTKNVHKGDGTFIGVAKISEHAFPSYLRFLNRAIEEGHLEDQCVHVLDRLIHNDHEVGFVQCAEDMWQHIDTAEDLERAHLMADRILR